jgi:phosphoribosyl-dephospho-CoA transferase
MERIEKLEEIAKQAAEVRRLQKVYFSLRTPGALKQSKSAEAILDKLLKEIESPDLPKLFNR